MSSLDLLDFLLIFVTAWLTGLFTVGMTLNYIHFALETKCDKCSNKVMSSALFCRWCGAKLK